MMDLDRDEGDSVNGSSNGTPAPYGRACTNCARAKCRCLYRTGVPDCERCHRLGKSCVPSVSVRRRNGKRAHVSRAAQLEEKIEDLVTLLRTQASPAGVATPPEDGPANQPLSQSQLDDNSPRPNLFNPPVFNPPSVFNPPPFNPPAFNPPVFHPPVTSAPVFNSRPAHDFPHTRPSTLKILDNSLIGRAFNPELTAQPAPPTPPPRDSGDIPSCPYHPTPYEAEDNLETFRKYMLIFLPLVYLPPTMTQRQLREQSPFLWFNIMAVTCKQVDHQMSMSDAIRVFLAHKMVVEHEKSIDLLLGLLVFIGWKQYHRREKPCLSLITSLAKSLVYDLGLNRVPGESIISMAVNFSEGRKVFLPPREKTLETRRALLACFYVTSHIAFTMKRIDAITWTPLMDEALEYVSEHREWDGDDMLVAQVKIQLILEQLTRATLQSQDSGPPSLFLSALQSQLQKVKGQLPVNLQQNDIIMSHLHYTELAIQETALAKPRPSSSFMPDLERYEILETRLRALKNIFDLHFSIPNYIYVGLTFAYWCQITHAMVSLYRLLLMNDPACDRRAIQSQLDIVEVCDRLTREFEEVAATRRLNGGGPGSSVEEDVFVRSAKLVPLMKNHWLQDVAAAEQQQKSTQQGQQPGQHQQQQQQNNNGASAATAPQAFIATSSNEIPSDGGATAAATSSASVPSSFSPDGLGGEAWLEDLFSMNWEM
ncbi:hypothetical protein B0H63DRAFT_215775 [Podospora didyma]|uniref:Zn(2)-C6 fungal-type domain-containing protein n=1 Tax=Podospora didyma TaxID=330526 RepID=A0AAE0TWC4_9PEZI|nr:hypothetical protein B0H63DRAFT_215775 [Podospora didyma]